MEDFIQWLEELKESIKTDDSKRIEKAELELKNFYGILLMQNDFFREEIEGLESRLNIEEETL